MRLGFVCYPKVQEAFEEIDRLYNDIFKDTDKLEIRHDPEFEGKYPNRYNLSKKSARFRSHYALLNSFLYELATKADEVADKRRKNKLLQRASPEDTVVYLPAYHRFFVAPDHDDTMPCVFASMYHKTLPPDKRLVYIELDKRERYALLSVLHEMGHYVGIRNREKRLEQYLIPLIADKICTELFELTCKYYCGIDPVSDISFRFDIDNRFSKRVQRFAQNEKVALEKVRSILCAKIRSTYYIVYKKQVERLQKADNLSLNNERIIKASNLSQCKLAAMRLGIFRNVEPILLTTLQLLFGNGTYSIAQEIISCATNEWNTRSIPKEEIDIMTKALREAVNTVHKDFLPNTNNMYKKPVWFSECEALLEEPAADIFMMKMTKISPAIYLDHVIRLYQTSLSINKKSALLEQLGMDEICVRVMSICMAMKASPCDFEKKSDKIVSRLDDSFRIKQRLIARHFLRDIYLRLQEEWNDCATINHEDSQQIVFDYVCELWSEAQYDDIKKDINNFDTKIKILMKNNKFIAFVLAWNMLRKETSNN